MQNKASIECLLGYGPYGPWFSLPCLPTLPVTCTSHTAFFYGYRDDDPEQITVGCKIFMGGADVCDVAAHERIVSRHANSTFVAKLLDVFDLKPAFWTCSVFEKWGQSVRDLALPAGQRQIRAALGTDARLWLFDEVGGLRRHYKTTLQRQVGRWLACTCSSNI
jgi:hypothetical protein